MKKREDKQKDLDALKAELQKCRNIIVAAFSGINVEQDFELRKQVRGAGGKYRVVKNTLAELAGKGTEAENVLSNLAGPTALAYTDRDPVALAKALTAYAKANPVFTFKAGIVEGRVISIKDIAELASMPSKKEIISKLLYLLNAGAQQLASVLSAVPRNLAVVVDQAAQQNKFQ